MRAFGNASVSPSPLNTLHAKLSRLRRGSRGSASRAKKRHTAEERGIDLRQADVELAKGPSITTVSKLPASSEQTCCDRRHDFGPQGPPCQAVQETATEARAARLCLSVSESDFESTVTPLPSAPNNRLQHAPQHAANMPRMGSQTPGPKTTKGLLCKPLRPNANSCQLL